MDDYATAGFWSYTHEDDKLDDGNILQLSQLIMKEYNLLSSEPLKLFVDRSDLAWGEQWRLRIDSSISEATFFIPIITPRYFKRPECRRELLEFAAKASMLGVEELLLPILYIETPSLSEDSPDEVIALIAKTQYADWRVNRLLEPHSREYRSAVNSLARRLLTTSREVAAVQLKRELSADPETDGSDGSDGIHDIVSRIEELLPEWLDAVMGEKSNNAQIKGVWANYSMQLDKLKRRKATSSALLSTHIRMAKEMLPLTERSRKDAEIYLARSVQLDPLVSELARLVARHPESIQLITPIREAINEAMEEILKADRRNYDTTIAAQLKKHSHLGRIFQQCAANLEVQLRDGKGGNEIVRRWNTEMPPLGTNQYDRQAVETFDPS